LIFAKPDGRNAKTAIITAKTNVGANLFPKSFDVVVSFELLRLILRLHITEYERLFFLFQPAVSFFLGRSFQQ
jgi:hypothetical protein